VIEKQVYITDMVSLSLTSCDSRHIPCGLGLALLRRHVLARLSLSVLRVPHVSVRVYAADGRRVSETVPTR
jgi:hypothetical protein